MCILLDEFEARGFQIIESVVPESVLSELRSEADSVLAQSGTRGGARHLLTRSERFAKLAGTGQVGDLARELLGSDAQPVKLTLFNKTPEANWKVPWHQDTMIPMRERREIHGFSTWTRKDGVWHARPSVDVLEQILTLRLHLDDTPAENGALRVLPGSHRLGVLDAEAIARMRQQTEEICCSVPAGGVMAMRPLLLHASSASDRPVNRRVLHFEYRVQTLSCGLEWPRQRSAGTGQ